MVDIVGKMFLFEVMCVLIIEGLGLGVKLLVVIVIVKYYMIELGCDVMNFVMDIQVGKVI